MNAELHHIIADQRSADLRREAQRARLAREVSQRQDEHIAGVATEPIAIRRAGVADQPAVARLAALDSRRAPQGEVLLALVAGEPRAALALDSGAAIADPFHASADVIDLLRARAATMNSGQRPPKRRRLRVTTRRPAAA
jgi:hypothetical protein